MIQSGKLIGDTKRVRGQVSLMPGFPNVLAVQGITTDLSKSGAAHHEAN
jgi:hypothetical protein